MPNERERPPAQGEAESPDALRPTQGIQARLRRVRDIFTRLGPASILSVVAVVSPFVGGLLILGAVTTIAPWLREHGWIGVAAYVVTYWILGGLALLPTYSHSALAGWSFGAAIGVGAALVSFTGASLVAYGIARLASGERVTQLIAENRKWQAVYDALLRSGFWKTLAIITLVRIPAAPFAASNVIMASARVPVVPYAIGTLLGLAPRTAFVAIAAARAEKLDLTESHQIVMYLVSLALAGVAVLVLALIARRALAKVTGGVTINRG